jgi:hypothetical protein
VNYLVIDFETSMTKTNTLSRQTTRTYLAQAEVLALGMVAHEPGGPVQLTPRVCRLADDDWSAKLAFLRHVCVNDDWCIVAHNASFDVRVLVLKLGLPWPKNVLCTKELAQAWSPNQPGGYSLDNLAKCWGLTYQKGKIDFATCTQAELEAYCAQDVLVCRELLQEALRRLPECELATARRTNAAKELVFEVDHAKVVDAVTAFDSNIAAAAAEASLLLGDDTGFGIEEGTGRVKSVRPRDIKRLLLDNLGFTAPTISLKKLNPQTFVGHTKVAEALKQVSDANKSLSHRRNAHKFHHVDIIDCELTYFAAHTGRFASRNEGAKGLNLHNLPKRNPLIAKPVRQMYRLPNGQVFVTGDLANVEYRIAMWLANCQYGVDLFGLDVMADPYVAFWKTAVGQDIDKKHPARQIAKAAVLGLIFMMGLQRWTEELAKTLAEKDPVTGKNLLTLDDIKAICADRGWYRNQVTDYMRRVITNLGVPVELVLVAEETRRRFHDLHPECGRLARWLEQATQELSRSRDPQQCLDYLYALPQAPLKGRLELSVDDTIQGRSVRARCGLWDTPTVTWRDLAIRQTKAGPGLTSVLAGNKGFRKLSLSTYIENVTQATARNALVLGQSQLEAAHPYQLSVHDAAMLITPASCPEILAARADMLTVFGPGNNLGYDWAVLIKPGDITVSKTLYEDEALMKTLWPQIEAGQLDESTLP